MRILSSFVLAIPTSSMVKQTKAHPNLLASEHTLSNFSIPSSRFTEFIIGFPPICLSATSSAFICVVSGISGKEIFCVYLPTTSLMSLFSSRPANPTLTSIP